MALDRISLTDFRNHAATELEATTQFNLLVGENGAGKTNILEALSLLAPGRGLRRAALADLVRGANGPLRIQGGGTRPIGTSDGELMSLAGLSGIELYEPGALTLVAKAGTPLADCYHGSAVRDLLDKLRIESDIRFAIDTRFRDAGISIAFPQRDVHVIKDA